MTKNTMQFLYGDRELLLQKADLFSAPVDVIVNAANRGLSHAGGVAEQFIERGGKIIQQESDQFINEHGSLESGMVAMTTAGALPYKAVLHAVGPRQGEGHEQEKVRQAVASCLKLCSMHDWASIAFPAISTGIFKVPVEVVAQGFFQAITSFWDARVEDSPGKIIICLTEDNFQLFFDAFRAASMIPGDVEQRPQLASSDDSEMETGFVELAEEDISALENDAVNEWFK